MVKCETCDKEIVSILRHNFPADIRKEGKYCVCIPWKTIDKCIELSLDNSQRLVEDAEYLLKGGRLSSAKILTVFSLEESGKALLACRYLAERKNIPEKDYRKSFLIHQIKIDEALKAIEELDPQYPIVKKAIWGNFARELRTQTLESIFVNYDGRYQMWIIPWVREPESIFKEYDDFIDLKMANDIRKAQEPIAKSWIEKLIEDTKTAIYCARQRYEQIDTS